MDSIREKIMELILEIGEVDNVELNDQTTFVGDLKYESIETVKLMVALEEEFGVDFGTIEEFLDKFERVNEFIDYVMECIEKSKS